MQDRGRCGCLAERSELPASVPAERETAEQSPAEKEHVPATPDAIAVAVTACRAADDKQATDLLVLDVADLLALVDLFVIATARSDRQLRAVGEAVEERLRAGHSLRPLRREGPAESGWLLLDYGDVVCHLFDQERREYYALERLWADVPQLDPLRGEPLPAARPREAEHAG